MKTIKEIPMNILEAVRQNLGAEDENDTSFDSKIIEMDAIEIMSCWSAWHLGDRSWAREIINKYEKLKKLCVLSEASE